MINRTSTLIIHLLFSHSLNVHGYLILLLFYFLVCLHPHPYTYLYMRKGYKVYSELCDSYELFTIFYYYDRW